VTSPDYPYTIWSEPYPGAQPEQLDRDGLRFVGEYSRREPAQAEALERARLYRVRHVVRDELGMTISEHLPPEESE
jgi:hypothetical protein